MRACYSTTHAYTYGLQEFVNVCIKHQARADAREPSRRRRLEQQGGGRGALHSAETFFSTSRNFHSHLKAPPLRTWHRSLWRTTRTTTASSRSKSLCPSAPSFSSMPCSRILELRRVRPSMSQYVPSSSSTRALTHFVSTQQLRPFGAARAVPDVRPLSRGCHPLREPLGAADCSRVP